MWKESTQSLPHVSSQLLPTLPPFGASGIPPHWSYSRSLSGLPGTSYASEYRSLPRSRYRHLTNRLATSSMEGVSRRPRQCNLRAHLRPSCLLTCKLTAGCLRPFCAVSVGVEVDADADCISLAVKKAPGIHTAATFFQGDIIILRNQLLSVIAECL